MRRIRRCLPIGLVLCLWVAPAFAQNAIRWTENLGDAQHIARRDGRLILVHFYADWCGPCRKLEHDVFPRTDVAAAILRNYVPVKINGDRFRDIARYYQVDRYPTDVITDASGAVVYRTVTPQDPARYVQLLDSVASDARFRRPGLAAANQAPPQRPPMGAAQPPSGSWNQPAYRPNAGSADPRFASGPSVPPTAPTGGQSMYAAGYERSSSYRGGYERSPSHSAGYDGRPPSDPGRYDAAAPYAAPVGNPYAASSPTEPVDSYPPRNGYYPPQDSVATPPARANQGRVDQFAQGPRSWDQPAQRSGWGTPEGGYAAPAQPEPRRDAPAGDAGSPVGGRQDRFASTPTASAEGPPVALDGFCPVTLQEQEVWRKGDPQWGAIHRGRTYLFTGQREQQRFLADPDRFSPVLSGYDPVHYIDGGQIAPGSREHGIWFRGKIYLFADEESLARFEQSSDYYAQRAHQIMMTAGR